ncbi:Hypothetical predicted protein [Octopus vulgaris]|uniref:Uncharacterized protein n=1 Tax=Octopus vulgaris TaxID=6645 RepID=A0AA36FIQ0_OCTVU|nr:Hypothetical predicted protein [Octopus vulgaris]
MGKVSTEPIKEWFGVDEGDLDNQFLIAEGFGFAQQETRKEDIEEEKNSTERPIAYEMKNLMDITSQSFIKEIIHLIILTN